VTNEELILARCIVPVLGLHPDGGCGPFLGTGFFVLEDHHLLTCAHVLKPWKGAYGITAQEDPPRLYGAEPIAVDEKRDLALLRVKDYTPEKPLSLVDEPEVTLNKLVSCYECGTTVVAGGNINLCPAFRLGNVSRVRDLTSRFGPAGDDMLELSFPALKGASGAPVLGWLPPFPVWGVVTANVSYELLPVQVEEIVDDKGQITEETKFYLPQALAIGVRVIRQFFAQRKKK
jgi:Trypsin-like peptidase domain